MAFGLRGVGGTAASATANQSSLALTTATTNGSIGDLAVLLVSCDNNQTTDGDENAVTSVTSTGNTWQKAAEFTNGQGSAQAGATVSMWYCNLTAAINTGSTITINFSNNASRDATAASLAYYTMAAGSIAALEGSNSPSTLANDGAAAGSLNLTTANIECLRVRATASESSTSTVWTKTAAFDGLFTFAGTASGGTTANIGVRGEYDISTGTSSASAPTAGAGAVDNASIYVAFKELVRQTLTAGLVTDSDAFSAPTVSHKLPVSALYADADTFYDPASIARGSVSLTFSGVYVDADTFFNPANLGHALPVSALYVDADSFYDPASIARGAVSLTFAGAYADADTFHQPTAQQDQSLTFAGVYEDADAFYDPASIARGAVTISFAGVYADADTFYDPAAAASYALAAGHVADADDVLQPAAAAGAVTLAADLAADADAFHQPAASATYVMAADLAVDADAFFAPAAEPGAVSLDAGLVADADAVHQPAAEASYGLVAGLVADADQFGAPEAAPGAVALDAGLVADSDLIPAPEAALPAYELAPEAYPDADQFGAPVAAAGAIQLDSGAYPDPDQFWEPVLTLGGGALGAALYEDADALHQPSVAAGEVALGAALYEDADALHQPSVSSAAATTTLSPALFSDAGSIYSAISTSTKTLHPSHVVRSDIFFDPSALVTKTPSHVVDADAFMPPAVGRGAMALGAPLVADADSIFAPALAEMTGLGAEMYVDADVIFSATSAVLRGNSLTLPPISVSRSVGITSSISATATTRAQASNVSAPVTSAVPQSLPVRARRSRSLSGSTR